MLLSNDVTTVTHVCMYVCWDFQYRYILDILYVDENENETVMLYTISIYVFKRALYSTA